MQKWKILIYLKMGKGIQHAERSSSKFKRQAPVGKKNISKKEADKVLRLKKHQKL
jgi:hypothetical protein